MNAHRPTVNGAPLLAQVTWGKMKTLITFGDSWVYGVGSAYQPEQNRNQYEAIRFNADLCEKNSFRFMLSQDLGVPNLNYSSMGSSNQRQFRFARQLDRQHLDDSLILWGITSLYRNEIWLEETNEWYNFQYAEKTDIGKQHLLNFDYEKSIAELLAGIKEMIEIAEDNGADIRFFDIFNHHDYGEDFDRVKKYFLFKDSPKRDLLSLMTGTYDTTQYFQSNLDDSFADQRIGKAVYEGLLNPYSWHPTKKGQKWIADSIKEQIQND